MKLRWFGVIRPRFNLISLLATISMIALFSAHLTSRTVVKYKPIATQIAFDRSMDDLLNQARVKRFVRESTQQFAMD